MTIVLITLRKFEVFSITSAPQRTKLFTFSSAPIRHFELCKLRQIKIVFDSFMWTTWVQNEACFSPRYRRAEGRALIMAFVFIAYILNRKILPTAAIFMLVFDCERLIAGRYRFSWFFSIDCVLDDKSV